MVVGPFSWLSPSSNCCLALLVPDAAYVEHIPVEPSGDIQQHHELQGLT